MPTMKQEWAKSYIVKPKDNIVSHVFIKMEKFIPTYEKNNCPVSMNWLLGWEYARIWLKERDDYIKAREMKATPKRIKNDYSKWLMKHTPKAKKVC